MTYTYNAADERVPTTGARNPARVLRSPDLEDDQIGDSYRNGFTITTRNENSLGIVAFHADGEHGAVTELTEEQEVELAKRRAGMV